MKLTIISALLLVSSTVHAEEFPGARLEEVGQWLIDVKADYGTSSTIKSTECPVALAAMRSGELAVSGNPAVTKFGGVYDDKVHQYVIPLDKAEALCKEATQMLTVVQDYALFSEMAREIWMLDDTTLGASIAPAFAERATACTAAVAKLRSAGIPDTFPYVVEDRDNKVLAKAVGDLEANICDATRKGAARYGKKLEEEERARNAKLTKAGITGDKMYWWKHYDGNLFTAGGREPELSGYGKASVWFAYTYSSNPDIAGYHLFSVRRYQFKGTKLVKQTEKTYRKPLSFKNAIGSVMK